MSGRPTVPVLCYHSVAETAPEGMERYTTSPIDLADHLAALGAAGYELIGVGELLARVDANKLGERTVVITFDDGFLDTLTRAAPLLADAGAGATAFVSTGLLRTSSARAIPPTWTMLAAEELSDLERAGVEVGAHGHSHCELDAVPRSRALLEIGISRSIVAAAIGHPVDLFAYPYGYADRWVRNALRDAGFRAACAVQNRQWSQDGDRFAIARFLVEADTTVDDVLHLVGANKCRSRSTVMSAGWRLVRRLRANPPPLVIDHPQSTTLTVAVCTDGGSPLLGSTVRSILGQTRLPDEVIVVDNSMSDAVAPALVSAGVEDQVRLVHEPRRGLSYARNAALATASSDLITFTDDDVLPDLAWLAAVVDPFDDPTVGAVSGPIVPVALDTPARVLFERFNAFDKGDRVLMWDRTPPPGDRLHPYAVGRFGSGANTTYRRDLLLAIGGFDVALGAGSRTHGGEDLDLNLRILDAGARIVYEPRAVVAHHHPASMPELHLQLRRYGTGLSAMLTKRFATEPTERFAMLRRLPLGIWYLIGPGSDKNGRRGPGYPLALTLAEARGLAAGPLAYVRSRVEASRPFGRLGHRPGPVRR